MTPSDPHDTYASPLVTRNASREMLSLFSARRKFGLWRRLWLALATAERQLGVDRITAEAIGQMAAHLDDVDFDLAADWERRLRHDVMAHVHTFEAAAPAAKGIIHLGATSQYVVDNADLILMRDGMRLVADRLANAIDALATFAERWKPTCPRWDTRTSSRPSRPRSASGRRCGPRTCCSTWRRSSTGMATLRFRGVKGTVGTQASFLALFDGDGAKCDQLDRIVTEQFGFDRLLYTVTGQTYPRKVDAASRFNALAAIGRQRPPLSLTTCGCWPG